MPGGNPSSAQRLTVGDVRYVVRRGTSTAGARDLGREFEVLKLLEGSGLAPAPVLLDSGKRFIVYEYLPGVAWSRNMLTDEWYLVDTGAEATSKATYTGVKGNRQRTSRILCANNFVSTAQVFDNLETIFGQGFFVNII